MGAYGHSRLRETILGGMTRGMLQRGAVPLLLAHWPRRRPPRRAAGSRERTGEAGLAIDRRLVHVWALDTRRERAMFEKLKDAYVKARYSKHYRVGAEQLAWLAGRIEEPGQAVHAVCAEHIAALEAQALDAR